jgi:hypothetical protein
MAKQMHDDAANLFQKLQNWTEESSQKCGVVSVGQDTNTSSGSALGKSYVSKKYNVATPGLLCTDLLASCF